MKTILETFGPPPSGGDVGIEIEVEGEGLPPRGFDIWAVKKDGSLKGEGYEYITKGAVKLENLRKGVENLNDKFKAAESVVHKAHRASVHIHVNAQHRTVYDVFGVLFAWAMVERVWMRLCGNTRESNLFCLPSSQSGHQIQFAKEMLQCCVTETWHNFPAKGKYDALNTDPIMNLGSVEFRTFPSSIDPDDIVGWAGWCTRLVEYGSKVDRDNLTKAWKGVFENPEEFLDTIFKGDEKKLLKYEAVQLVKDSCEDASDLALVWANHKIELAKQKLKPKLDNSYWAKPFAPPPPERIRARQRAGWNDFVRAHQALAQPEVFIIDDELPIGPVNREVI